MESLLSSPVSPYLDICSSSSPEVLSAEGCKRRRAGLRARPSTDCSRAWSPPALRRILPHARVPRFGGFALGGLSVGKAIVICDRRDSIRRRTFGRIWDGGGFPRCT